MSELLILSRAVHIGSCLVLLAIYAVRLLIERPAVESVGQARGLAGLCLAGAAVSGFLWFWVAVAGMSGSGMLESLSPQLFRMVIEQTPPGHVWAFRVGAGALLVVVLCIPRGAWRWRLGGALAAVIVGSLAWLGHAGAGEDGRLSWMLAGDILHLLAAGLWPAGLAPFALLLRRRIKAGELAAARIAVRRFSAMSLATVAVLAASGMVNAWFLVGSFHALVESDYGRLLVAKLALFFIALAFGGWNLLVHKPRIETTTGALHSIERKVWLEAALGALIVVVVAIMGTLPPGAHP